MLWYSCEGDDSPARTQAERQHPDHPDRDRDDGGSARRAPVTGGWSARREQGGGFSTSDSVSGRQMPSGSFGFSLLLSCESEFGAVHVSPILIRMLHIVAANYS